MRPDGAWPEAADGAIARWDDKVIFQNHVYRNGALLDGYTQSGDWLRAWHPDIVLSGHQKAMLTDEPYISNDTISSVMVPPGYELVLYAARDFVGAARRITGNVPYLGDDWNDIASSLQVRKAGPGQGRRNRR